MFAVEVVSAADDYRYARQQGSSVTLRASTLPRDVEERVPPDQRRAQAAARRDRSARSHPGGEWYCFEVNPSPCFSY